MLKSRLWAMFAAIVAAGALALTPLLGGTAQADVTVIGVAAPPTGPVNTSVSITGTMTASSSYTVRWDGAAGPVLASGTSAAGTGNVNATVRIPAATAGVHQIYLVQVGSLVTKNTPFTVTGSVVVSPSTGWVGRTGISLSGTGFGSLEPVAVTFDGAPLVTSPLTITTNANGSWGPATFTVPAPIAPGGAHTIQANGATETPTVTFTTPSLTLTPATGAVGTVVQVDGVGFQSGETGITIKYDAAVVTTTPATITAATDGTWSATFVVPLSTQAGHIVSAFGAITPASQVPSQTFTVAPGISLNPTSGPVGTTILVTGTGYTHGAPAVGDANITVSTTLPLTSRLVNANTSGAWTMTIIVPETPGGGYTVTGAAGADDPGRTFTMPFTVTPKITPAQTSGGPGTLVTITGTGFLASEGGITITWDGTPVTTSPAAPVTSAAGTWTAGFTVPLGSTGQHTIDAKGATTTYAQVPDITFQVLGLTVSPITGNVGTTVTVSAVGFQASETGIAVTWDGTPIASGLTAAAGGTWTTTFTVPAASSGAHTIDAYGSVTLATSVPDQTFTVTPAITVSPTTGIPGGQITLTGTGFNVLETGITITWDGLDSATVGSANATGGWTYVYTLPTTTRGVHLLNVYGASTVKGTLNDVPITITPNFTISPISGVVGATVTAGGSGFGAVESGIQIFWDSTVIKVGVIANAAGSWTATFAVPATPGGTHTVTATGSTTPAGQVPAATFTVQRTIAITPTSSYTGKVVTFTGNGFAGSTPIAVKFDGTAVQTTPTVVTSGPDGTISGSFVAPAGTASAHTVTFSDGSATASATFTITSSAASSISSGVVGAASTVSGQGMPPSTPVTFVLDSGTTNATTLETTPSAVSTDQAGAFSASIKLPNAARGNHVVTITVGPAVLTLNVEVKPALAASAASGPVGSTTTLTGSGFGSSEPITFTVDGAPLATTPSSVMTTPTGGFTAAIALPTIAGGAHVIKVSDKAASMQVNFSVTATAATTATSVKVGDNVSVSGNGFPSRGTITVTVDGAAAATNPSPLVADGTGSFSGLVVAPAGAFGNHTVTFNSGSLTSQVTYSIQPSFVTTPGNGNVGTSVTLTGAGYAASSPITITYDGNALSQAAANVQGGFTATVTIPKSPHGAHIIAAADNAGHSLQSQYVMESTAPGTPAGIAPISGSRMGVFGGIKPAFTWTEVTDPSGVTYSLQVSKDPAFATVVLNKTGLTSGTYQLANSEELGGGLYYWRVKAIDGASNESAWSQSSMLKIGVLPTWMPLWLFILVCVVVVGLIAAAVYLLLFGRRANKVTV